MPRDRVVYGIEEKCLEAHPAMFRASMSLADSKIRHAVMTFCHSEMSSLHFNCNLHGKLECFPHVGWIAWSGQLSPASWSLKST